MMIEIEIPDEALTNTDLKLQVTMESTQFYFMLASKYNEPLAIQDPRVQAFYKQMYSSMAMTREQKQFFGQSGQVPKRNAYRDEDRVDTDSSRQPSACSIERQLAKHVEEIPTLIFMLQHYCPEHKGFVQHIQNDSDECCYATTSVSYKNMLQMGDSPQKGDPV